MIKAEVINRISAEEEIKKLNTKVKNASAVLINEVIRISKDFTPRRAGDLEGSLKIEKKGDEYIGISYNMPYARRMWYGEESWNWTRRPNSQAGPRWVKRAFDINGNEVIKSVAEAIKL